MLTSEKLITDKNQQLCGKEEKIQNSIHNKKIMEEGKGQDIINGWWSPCLILEEDQNSFIIVTKSYDTS